MNKIEVCPLDSKVCDRSCGYKVHFNVTRATKPEGVKLNVCSKYAEDCDYKCGFDVHESKNSTGNTNNNICLSCEG